MHRSFIAIPSRRNPVSAFNRMETAVPSKLGEVYLLEITDSHSNFYLWANVRKQQQILTQPLK